MPLQFKNSEGQVFLGCLGEINYCLFLYCSNTTTTVTENYYTTSATATATTTITFSLLCNKPPTVFAQHEIKSIFITNFFLFGCQKLE